MIIAFDTDPLKNSSHATGAEKYQFNNNKTI